jgi:hypothetical protein
VSNFCIGPIQIKEQPYWGAWKCDGVLTFDTRTHELCINCMCGFQTQFVPMGRISELNEILDWHDKDQREKFLKPYET